MTTRTLRGRHRAAGHATSPLTSLGRTASLGMTTVARRSAAVAVSSGLMVSALALPAAAPAAAAENDASATGTLDLSAVTAQAREALAVAPALSVPADAQVSVETAAVAVTPAPEPEPEPAPVVRQTTRAAAPASRSESRAATTATTEKAAAAAPAAAASGSSVVDIAMRYVGVPYVSGGSSPAGFDCSGLVSYVYAQLGVSLPHQSTAIKNAGTIISASEARPGDLIWSPGHISIYAGNGMQVEATVPGSTVKYSKIWQNSPTFVRVG